jgi:hypothetical protein
VVLTNSASLEKRNQLQLKTVLHKTTYQQSLKLTFVTNSHKGLLSNFAVCML